MMRMILFLICFVLASEARDQRYTWQNSASSGTRRINNISVPRGFERVRYTGGSFQAWMQNLPLKESDHMISTYRGKVESGQGRHYRIIDIDVGDADLQQCADTVMRFYAEYLYSRGSLGKIQFNFTSGDPAPFSKWTQGYRPVVRRNSVEWRKTAQPDKSYRTFREYLNIVFSYAGSLSLSREMRKVAREDIQPGDVFIRGGTPGHAVIVVDVAKNNRGEVYFLLAQSDMPAQDVHILHNKKDSLITPWFSIYGGSTLRIPNYNFRWSELKRFR